MLMPERGCELTQEPDPKPGRPEGLVRREAITVRGVVQGVGFRPFVYRLATEEGLAGFIGNDTGGVTIEIEGPADRVEAFRRRLKRRRLRFRASIRCLPSALLQNKKKASGSSPARRRPGFDRDSRRRGDLFRLPARTARSARPPLSLSVSELHQLRPALHHHARIPYDRPQTSMAKFKMCPACQAEYDDPTNRRFHAQPNACPVCGPRVWLVRPTAQRFRRAIRWAKRSTA
jgi:hydrogenase maturation protein HypF